MKDEDYTTGGCAVLVFIVALALCFYLAACTSCPCPQPQKYILEPPDFGETDKTKGFFEVARDFFRRKQEGEPSLFPETTD